MGFGPKINKTVWSTTRKKTGVALLSALMAWVGLPLAKVIYISVMVMLMQIMELSIRYLPYRGMSFLHLFKRHISGRLDSWTSLHAVLSSKENVFGFFVFFYGKCHKNSAITFVNFR